MGLSYGKQLESREILWIYLKEDAEAIEASRDN